MLADSYSYSKASFMPAKYADPSSCSIKRSGEKTISLTYSRSWVCDAKFVRFLRLLILVQSGMAEKSLGAAISENFLPKKRTEGRSAFGTSSTMASIISAGKRLSAEGAIAGLERM